MSDLKQRARALHERIPDADQMVAHALPDLYEDLGPVLVGLAIHYGFDRGEVTADELALRAKEKYGSADEAVPAVREEEAAR